MVQFPSSHPLLACRESVFIATVLSTVCLMSAVILLPIAHLHTQQRVSSLLANVDLCKMEARDVWRRVPPSSNRQRRDNNPYTRYSAIMSNSQGACCSCSQGEGNWIWLSEIGYFWFWLGPPGARGKRYTFSQNILYAFKISGRDGRPGKDGNPGSLGYPGRSAKYLPAPPAGTDSCQKVCIWLLYCCLFYQFFVPSWTSWASGSSRDQR